MRKIIIALAAIAAFTFVSCSKEEQQQIETPSNNEINLNITVGNLDGGADTKAIKKGWAAGDKINVYFDATDLRIAPHLILTYDGEKWTAGALNYSGSIPANGRLFYFYEGHNDLSKYETSSTPYLGVVFRPSLKKYVVNPKVWPTLTETAREQPLLYVHDEETPVNYSFDSESNTLTATLDSWKSMTKVQVVVTGLEKDNASNYALYLKGCNLADSYKSYSDRFDESGTRGGFTLGISNDDGVAFYLNKPSKDGWSNNYTFYLYDTTNQSEKFYDVGSKKISTGKNTVYGIKVDVSQFSPVDNS